MKDVNALVKAAITTAFATAAVSTAVVPASAQAADNGKQKCYGVVKAGMNDCGTAAHDCAGVSKKDSDPAEWVFMPAGLCDKITGGSTKPPSTDKSADDHQS